MQIKLHPIFPFAGVKPVAADAESQAQVERRERLVTAAAVTVAVLIVALVAMVMGLMA